MDANKRLELMKIGYAIQGTCGMCKHGFFPNDSFGTCAIHSYQHLKHTGDRRQLSVYAHGRCNHFELDEKAARLGLWHEFLLDPEKDKVLV